MCVCRDACEDWSLRIWRGVGKAHDFDGGECVTKVELEVNADEGRAACECVKIELEVNADEGRTGGEC